MVMRDAFLTLTRGLQARDTLLKQAVIKMDNDAKSLVEKKKKLIAEESKLQLYQGKYMNHPHLLLPRSLEKSGKKRRD